MRNKYRVLEHTADVGLLARGDTLAEAFTNAGLGMFAIMVDLRTVRPSSVIYVDIVEETHESLLFEWLNRLLYYFDTQNILFRKLEIRTFENYHITAVCYGEVYNSQRHAIKTGIKSATFHRIMVDAKTNQVRVFLDV